jgi:hypothetical protein
MFAWIREPRSMAAVDSVVRYFTAASTLPASRSSTRRSAFSIAACATWLELPAGERRRVEDLR